jgi:hypothetical protein
MGDVNFTGIVQTVSAVGSTGVLVYLVYILPRIIQQIVDGHKSERDQHQATVDRLCNVIEGKSPKQE